MYSLKKNSQPNTDPDGLYWWVECFFQFANFLRLIKIVVFVVFGFTHLFEAFEIKKFFKEWNIILTAQEGFPAFQSL